MKIAFIIWSLCAVIFICIGLVTINSKKRVGFFTGIPAPEDIKDIEGYNTRVAKIWYVFAFLFEILGLPLLKAKQNDPIVLLSSVAVIFLVIGIITAYTIVLNKYKKK